MLTPRLLETQTSVESPITGSNTGKGWSFVIGLSHPRDPKNVAPGTLRNV